MATGLSLPLSTVIDGFLLAAEARRLSPSTVRDYRLTLDRFREWLPGDPGFRKIGAPEVRGFLAWLSGQEVMRGTSGAVAGSQLSRKTVLNAHTGLGALWTWAVAEKLAAVHVLRLVERPKPSPTAIVPFSEEDVQAILQAAERSSEYVRPGKRACSNRRPTGVRDRAIVLLLLDTGMRASELCGLALKDVDQRNRRCWVTGKGDKERALPFSVVTARAVWHYVVRERGEATMADPVFATRAQEPLTRMWLLHLLQRLGDRAGVPNVHPHRFRHTFAIQALRNGMNVFALQDLLGHTSLDMVRKYLRIAQADVERAHQLASPVANWRLSGGK